MKIVRFDEEVSVPVPRRAPRAHLATLAAPGAEATVQLLRLPADGRFAAPATGTRRLLAVVGGSGWVRGDTRAGGSTGPARIEIGPDHGVVWEPGEPLEVASAGGLRAVVVDGTFDTLAMWVSQDIIVEEPDPAWAEWFVQLRDRIAPVVAPLALRIDHVGSTLVPGLAAKPIIDMDVVVATDGHVEETVARLESLGYVWRGELGVPGRQAFARPVGDDLPRHHLYVVVEGTKCYEDHWLLRDLLRADPEARDRYATLKRRNAEAAAGDMDVYVAAKAGLVAELLTRARAERGLPPAEYWQPD